MGLGGFLEPLVVVSLLFGGTWWNRNKSLYPSHRVTRRVASSSRSASPDSEESLLGTAVDEVSSRRVRRIQIFGWKRDVSSPNTQIFEDRLLSRLLRKYPFLAEAWYWALIYWVYQLGRAVTAVTLVQDTVDVARRHALELVAIEQRLHIFFEPAIQAYFLQYPSLMRWINWLYSFIHIPATIFFLVYMYWFCITRHRITHQPEELVGQIAQAPASPLLYEARRRTMAMCNLLAFIVFTLWPCMPPRLLSDPSVIGAEGDLARSFGFIDTVHGKDGDASVWTQNKFCNQYAAMPSLHFGYSLMIGLTIGSLPLAPTHRSRSLFVPLFGRVRLPSARRALCLAVGFLYPFTILVAIVSTANHFILDAVAGACVCGLGWYGNTFLLNLLPLEDHFLALVRIHKPQYPVAVEPGQEQIRLSIDEEKDGYRTATLQA